MKSTWILWLLRRLRWRSCSALASSLAFWSADLLSGLASGSGGGYRCLDTSSGNSGRGKSIRLFVVSFEVNVSGCRVCSGSGASTSGMNVAARISLRQQALLHASR